MRDPVKESFLEKEAEKGIRDMKLWSERYMSGACNKQWRERTKMDQCAAFSSYHFRMLFLISSKFQSKCLAF